MNVLIETSEELILFYTTSLERAKEVLKTSGIEYLDIYEIQDDEIQYHIFSDRVFDINLEESNCPLKQDYQLPNRG